MHAVCDPGLDPLLSTTSLERLEELGGSLYHSHGCSVSLRWFPKSTVLGNSGFSSGDLALTREGPAQGGTCVQPSGAGPGHCSHPAWGWEPSADSEPLHWTPSLTVSEWERVFHGQRGPQ